MRLKTFVSSLFIALSLFCAPSAFAGGPLASISADTDGWTSDSGYGRVIRIFLNPGIPCKGAEITFKFTDSKDGDYVMTSSGNSTYTMSEDRGSNGCGTYAKMASKESSTRTITAVVKSGGNTYVDPYMPTIKVDFDGKFHGDSAYDDYNYRSSTQDPYGDYPVATNPTSPSLPTIKDEIKVWLLDQKMDKSVGKYGGRAVTIKWTAANVSGYKVLYDISITEPGGQTSVRQGEYGPSAILYLDNNVDYRVKVTACIQKVGNCVASNEIVIGKVSALTNTPTTTTKETEKTTKEPEDSVTSSDDQKVSELNKKVSDLQNQLDQSKKTQSVLEQRVNDLVSFIKKIFPFFK